MKVAIAGYGVEGKASYQYWRAKGDQVTIVDERPISAHDLPYGASAITGPDSFKDLEGFDVVVRSPGIAPDQLKTDGKVWSATNEFMVECQTPIIGVTGSKGKGTTASLINSILRAAGLRTVLVGNIGQPALEVLDEANQADVVVFEMSSFQLWDITKSPHVAVLLPIEPDHLDVHKNMREYVEAKMNIVRFQSDGDICVYHYSHSNRPEFPETKASYREYPSQTTVYAKDGWFYAKDRQLCPVDSLQLPGQHNIDNACAAIVAAATLIPTDRMIRAGEIIGRGLNSFNGLPHRLKLVAEKGGVGYYDDSIATTPGSAIAAVRAFEQPKVLILGGSDKGAAYKELAETIAGCPSMRAILVIGQIGDKVEKSLKKAGVKVAIERLAAKDMTSIVAAAAAVAHAGDVVVLSPAAASFDMFKSYADRGDQFIAAVNRLDA